MSESVIVPHSPKIAEGAADMVRQMVGDSAISAYTGGDPGAGLGTGVVSRSGARDRPRMVGGRWSILARSGAGAETNSEMAVEMLDAERRGRVVVATPRSSKAQSWPPREASGGSTLETVRRTAEELSPQ